ncbi:hypothetical protein ACFO4L_11485 [Bacillus daqingensis]|uniref:Uncharacterized protein n=1 Tax=Bacillus daqingensis TaxID=872396 RepID=A0ABV9NYL2_9BACI
MKNVFMFVFIIVGGGITIRSIYNYIRFEESDWTPAILAAAVIVAFMLLNDWAKKPYDWNKKKNNETNS